jgi:tRNA A-37 threonylcarbamoyl transferase component Bud32/membrane-associated phospholipid phosphatase
MGQRLRRPSGEPPPLPRELNRTAIGWLVGFVGWCVVWLWAFHSSRTAVWITRRDLEVTGLVVDSRQTWLDPMMVGLNRIGGRWAVPVLGWTIIASALAWRRVRHAVLFVLSLAIVAAVTTTAAAWLGRPRPVGVDRIGHWEGFAQPSRPVAFLAVVVVAAGLVLVPTDGSSRLRVLPAGAALLVFGLAQVYVGVDHPTDVLAGATVGVALTLGVYRIGAPEKVFPITYGGGNTAHLDVGGARGEAIRSALRRQLGIEVVEVEPVGLAGSAGSTPLRIAQRDGPDLFAKLYATSHLRSDRFYKLGRTLRYGRLEDEHRFGTVRRLIEHEDYLLHVMARVGIDVTEPMGVVEITPEREYLLVTEFLDDAVEIGDATTTTAIVDAGLATVAHLWDAGLAHRDIKPSNVMVQGGRLRLVDVAFAQIRPSPWRQAVDLANMMLVLALGTTPEVVHRRALCHFTDREIAEAFAATRGVTMPGQLRDAVRADGRDLVERFRQLGPDHPPVGIQRWTLRRAGLTIWVGLVTMALVALFVGNSADIGLR